MTRGYGELRAEFDARRPEDVSKTWYEPDQTVGFWFRRMAQETVIHRIDAELGAAAPIAPVPDDLAVDGIDELLKVFVAYAFSQWPEDFTEALQNSPGRTFLIRTDATTDSPSVSWLVSTAPDHLTVEGGPAEKLADDAAPDVTISGTPTAILRWAWNRETPESQVPTYRGQHRGPDRVPPVRRGSNPVIGAPGESRPSPFTGYPHGSGSRGGSPDAGSGSPQAPAPSTAESHVAMNPATRRLVDKSQGFVNQRSAPKPGR